MVFVLCACSNSMCAEAKPIDDQLYRGAKMVAGFTTVEAGNGIQPMAVFPGVVLAPAVTFTVGRPLDCNRGLMAVRGRATRKQNRIGSGINAARSSSCTLCTLCTYM